MTYSEQAKSLDHLAASINEKYEKLADFVWRHLVLWITVLAWSVWAIFDPDRLSVPWLMFILMLIALFTVHWFILSDFSGLGVRRPLQLSPGSWAHGCSMPWLGPMFTESQESELGLTMCLSRTVLLPLGQ